mmetsp:Transcript_14971/g.34288  ORF Transcript_14971/g.34288 Transcript_14971/m.34288 type:complete len:458 (+) Transcript_14971:812-2185(+)
MRAKLIPGPSVSAASSASSTCTSMSVGTLIKLPTASRTCTYPAWQPVEPRDSSPCMTTTMSPSWNSRTLAASATTLPTADWPSTRFGAKPPSTSSLTKARMSASPRDATSIFTSASPEPIIAVTPMLRVCTPLFVTCTTARVLCGMEPSSNAPTTSEMALLCSKVPSKRGLAVAACTARFRWAASISLRWFSSSTLAAVAEAFAMKRAIIPPTPPRPLMAAAASLCQLTAGIAATVRVLGRRTSKENWCVVVGISLGMVLSADTETPSTSAMVSPTRRPAAAAAPLSLTASSRPSPYMDIPSSPAGSRPISMQSSSKPDSRQASTSSSMPLRSGSGASSRRMSSSTSLPTRWDSSLGTFVPACSCFPSTASITSPTSSPAVAAGEPGWIPATTFLSSLRPILLPGRMLIHRRNIVSSGGNSSSCGAPAIGSGAQTVVAVASLCSPSSAAAWLDSIWA